MPRIDVIPSPSAPPPSALPPSGSERADPQAQLLEDTWLLTLFAALLASAFPWFVSSLDIELVAASWAMLALGIIYIALSFVLNLPSQSAGLRRRASLALHAAGVIALGFLWHFSGGLQNPAFLLAFVLPVIGASALSRGQPYVTATLTAVVVGAVALRQAPELRWYTADLHGAGRWLTQLLGAGAPTASAGIFPGFYAPVGYDVVLLEVFAILIFACAVAAESLGYAFERVVDHLTVARAKAARGEALWTTLLQQLPLPALLVDTETLQIVLASERLAPFHAVDATLIGRGLFDAIRVSYPERVQELITGRGGNETVVVQAADQLRTAEVHVQHILQEGRRLALVLLEDTTVTFCVTAAFDTSDQAALVIDAAGRVMAANKPARALFPQALPGSDAARVLAPASAAADAPAATPTEAAVARRSAYSAPAGPLRWWEPGLTGRRRLYVTLARHSYQATCTAVALPGEQQPLHVVALAPAWSGASTAPAAALAPETVASERR
ncbi:MAG: hypothetical protein ACRET0_13035 [Steroidobacteraceae bacterium]